MDEFYIGQIFEGEYPPEAANWCNTTNRATIAEIEPSETGVSRFQIAEIGAPRITAADYDQALEKHIYDTRVARGYTTREPYHYFDSSVPRWKQDAIDWVAFIDQCMLYGLEIQNQYNAGNSVPSLDEFKKALPEIVWTYAD